MKKQNKFRKMLQSKKTTTILLILILTPILIFGFVLLRDTMQTGTPVVGSRNDNQLEHKITKDHLKQIEEGLSDEMYISKEVNLNASTLRINVKVSRELSGEIIYGIGETIYGKVNEIIPIETYFTNTEGNKQYDLEIQVYTDEEGEEIDDIWILNVLKSGAMEEPRYEWITDVRDEDLKNDVIDTRDKKKAEAEANEKEGTEEETEGGE